jgi:hypothetical protein
MIRGIANLFGKNSNGLLASTWKHEQPNIVGSLMRTGASHTQGLLRSNIVYSGVFGSHLNRSYGESLSHRKFFFMRNKERIGREV